MDTRLGLVKPIDPDKVGTPVYDAVSCFIPDQSIGLRDLLMRFAYIGTDRLEEIVNRGFDGDEDEADILGVDIGALDFAEIHDRIIELEQTHVNGRSVASYTIPEEPETHEPEEPDNEDER